MAILTLTIDDQVLRRARIRALELGTSVDALVRTYPEGFAVDANGAAAVTQFLEVAERSEASSAGRRAWTRHEIHDR